MKPEDALTYITIIAAIGTAANVWLTVLIQKSVLGLKLWATEKFVAKDDMSTYLSPIKETIQMVGSARRLNDQDPGFPAHRR